jgi:uncharacterized protein YjbI with pentapeptide repeats
MGYRYCWIASAFLLTLIDHSDTSRGDIYRWDTGTVIQGTQGIEPLPGVALNNRILDFADLSNANLSLSTFASSDLIKANFTSANLSSSNFTSSDLTKADFTSANLTSAKLENAILAGANLVAAKLTNAKLHRASLANATFARAAVTGANFGGATSNGFTQGQLYSTASYIAKDLQRIELWGNDLRGWAFNGQNLTDALFAGSTLTNASFAGAKLTRADLSSVMLANANFRGANLTGADLLYATLANADFTDAIVTAAFLSGATSRGLTKEQLYSTASYKAKNLRGIGLSGFGDAPFYFLPGAETDLTGWDFSDQDVTGANLGGATLTNTDLSGAVVKWASLADSTARGFTKEQLYSTASFQFRDLAGIHLSYNDLTGWSFVGQNLVDAVFYSATLHDADLSGADTRGALGLDLTGSHARNTIFPDGKVAGLALATGERLLVRDDDGVPYTSQPSSLPAILDAIYNLHPTPRPPIPVAVHDRLTMAGGSFLQLLFDTDNWDSLISFEPGIPIELGGALDLTFANDVNLIAQVGRTLRIFDWTGVMPSGQFEVRSPHVWDVSSLYTTGEVKLLAVPEPSAAFALLVAVEALTFRGRAGHRPRHRNDPS